MTTQEHDTDPSTPGAKRVTDPRISAEVGAGRPPEKEVTTNQATTDPGVAPPPEPLVAIRQPMGIVVPPVLTNPNDSVEILLEGIDHYRPERPRPTPHTAGQAVASYHVEHAVPAPQTTAETEPKVVAERRVLAQTIRVARAKAADRKAITNKPPPDAQPVAGRMAIAVVAGLGVVGLIYFVLRQTSGVAPPPVGRSVAASVAVTSGPPRASPAEDARVLAATQSKVAPEVVAVAVESLPSTAASATATRKPATVARPNKARSKPAPSAMPTATDVGEFRTSF